MLQLPAQLTRIPPPPRQKLNASDIEKYVEDLYIPIVLYDVNVTGNVSAVSMRQITQQVLPCRFPKTTLWAYGNPENPATYHHPAGTIENTEFTPMSVTWINELVVDPDECRNNPGSDACNYLQHVVQDKHGVPLVDQTLHWAAPNQECKEGVRRTDCKGYNTEPYNGPVPITTHVHGAHVEYHSDGYPESWFLPNASNIPQGYATQGTYYATEGDYSNQSGEGSALYRYDNDEKSTSLYYHDHTLGLTRLNVYAAGAGLWLIRSEENFEDFLEPDQKLPGPPVKFGEDPNLDINVRGKIREIPLIIQQMSFYDDGSLFYPANRVNHYNSTCSDGTVFADTSGNPSVNFLPYNNSVSSTLSDLSPTWNPEAFFDTWVVNGKTWPKLDVAPERYRFRVLNLADSASLNILLKTENGTELPIYIVGAEQGLLPWVVKITTGNYMELNPNETKWSGPEYPHNETKKMMNERQAFLLGPGERYDVIFDFTGLPNGTEIIMHNTAPDSPFQGFDSTDYTIANENTTGQVMKFIVKDELRNPEGDTSTVPGVLDIYADRGDKPEHTDVAHFFIQEKDSDVCVDTTSICDPKPTQCSDKNNSYGPVMAMLGCGKGGGNNSMPSMWKDPICWSIKNGTSVLVNIWNRTPDAHPIHFHLVNFNVQARYNLTEFETNETNATKIADTFPWEYTKDIVLVYPDTVTQLVALFDRPGRYAWHCHILSHEDNEMMLPYCVGDLDVDCPNPNTTAWYH